MWINFQPFGMGKMFIYWPVIFIGLSVLILFFPAKILYHRSRTWWLYSNVSLPSLALTLLIHPVALVACWTLSSRVPRLLPWRHVLLRDL